jgi:hypothetical protein
LSNRNHPNESGNVIALRRKLGTLAAEAVEDYNFAYVPGALEPVAVGSEEHGAKEGKHAGLESTLEGIDVLVKQRFAPLKGMRLGLVTNHTGHDRRRNTTIDLLSHAPEVQLKALFSPEHGIRGARTSM